MADSSWRNLSEMELHFARSRRRAKARRKEPPKRPPIAWRSVRAGLLSLLLLTVVAESTRLESSNAKPPAARASAPALDTAYEESHMNPSAQSHAGARGLLQLMPATARELRLDGDDPATNVLAGARYLRQLLARFGSVELALAAYNAGPTAVARAGAAPTVGTLRYVKNVQARAGQLLSC